MLKDNCSYCTLIKNCIIDVFNIWTIEDKKKITDSKEIFENEIK